ncbi:MAG: hypothetical protein ACOC0U_06485 [Desulfovibrionales bacterium]
MNSFFTKLIRFTGLLLILTGFSAGTAVLVSLLQKQVEESLFTFDLIVLLFPAALVFVLGLGMTVFYNRFRK